jgi:FkbM family methyltransferase
MGHQALSPMLLLAENYRQSVPHMRKIVKSIRPSIGSDLERIVGWAAARCLPRKVLNAIYNRLSYRQKGICHARFAKLFRHGNTAVEPGEWIVRFYGRQVRVPLHPDSMWLDWDSALSVLGHEPEIKETYEALVGNGCAPRCVFDIGANYGLHSLLLLAHGVRVISFEPNPACHEFLARLENLNGLRFSVEGTAVGSIDGTAELFFPDTNTWLGSIDPNRIRELSREHELRRVKVPCISLDSYVRNSGLVPDVIKLDTEGNELQILEGASDTLESEKPILIFECWRNSDREQLWRFLDRAGFATVRLPLLSLDAATPMELSAFLQSNESNFSAVPREKLSQ